MKTGQVIGRCHQRHRHQEFLRFLNHVDATVREACSEDVEVHLVLDNYATHKTPRMKRGFATRPRYHLHFTPTGASWLNQVEQFFAALTTQRIRCGVFRSVPAVRQAIRDYLDHHNTEPTPFTWTADADTILERVANVCQ